MVGSPYPRRIAGIIVYFSRLMCFIWVVIKAVALIGIRIVRAISLRERAEQSSIFKLFKHGESPWRMKMKYLLHAELDFLRSQSISCNFLQMYR